MPLCSSVMLSILNDDSDNAISVGGDAAIVFESQGSRPQQLSSLPTHPTSPITATTPFVTVVMLLQLLGSEGSQTRQLALQPTNPTSSTTATTLAPVGRNSAGAANTSALMQPALQSMMYLLQMLPLELADHFTDECCSDTLFSSRCSAEGRALFGQFNVEQSNSLKSVKTGSKYING